MKAIVQTAYGSSDVLNLQTLPTPEPGENEVLVRIMASSVTRADTMMRSGTPVYGRLFLGLLRPKYQVSGTGFSGIVESVGAQVSRYRPGDAIFGESVLGAGTNSEFVVVPEDGVSALKPESISHAEAAPVCDGALTAYNFLNVLGDIKAGQRVLINGAAGSLGSAAVQIARQAGAHVTGVCSTRNIDFVRSLGADAVIDYTQQDFTRTADCYDLIFDSVGKSSYRRCKNRLTESGKYLSPVLSLPLLCSMLWTQLTGSRRAVFSATGLLPEKDRLQMLEVLCDWLADGQLKTVVDSRYKLADIARAHHYVDTGHKRGNLIIDMAMG